MLPNAERIAKALGAKRSGDGWSAKCPAHDDSNPSLSISDSEKGPLVHCHAGCEQADVIQALRERDLWPSEGEIPSAHGQLGAYSAHWDYHDANGQHVMRVCRWNRANGKEIRPLTLQGGRWTWKSFEKNRPLYRLPALKDTNRRVLVCEGEKATVAAQKFFPEMIATTWSGGAKAISKTDWKPLAGRDVTLVADNDEPGKKAMESLAAILKAQGCTVRHADLSKLGDLPEGWDVADALGDKTFDLDALWSAIENAERASVEAEPADPKRDPLAWLEQFRMSKTEVEQIADPSWIESGLIAEAHIVAIVAKPNGGKTTILFDLACRLPKRGYTVVYVDADTHPADAKQKWERAEKSGVSYLTPDMKVGMSMTNVVEHLQRLADSDVDLSGHVWFFDTLKKMANVIHKESMKATFKLLRKLSGRGMTCVLLGHTNKYRNADGEYQYEGTGDLEADVDELIYFEPQANDDGSLVVSTRCAKRRASIENITWRIDPDRSVVRLDTYVDVAAEIKAREQREQDAAVIEAITDALGDGPKNQTDVLKHCAPLRMTEKRVRHVLRRYSGELWRAERLFQKNAWRYELVEQK